jgi:hypothetical protein
MSKRESIKDGLTNEIYFDMVQNRQKQWQALESKKFNEFSIQVQMDILHLLERNVSLLEEIYQKLDDKL